MSIEDKIAQIVVGFKKTFGNKEKLKIKKTGKLVTTCPCCSNELKLVVDCIADTVKCYGCYFQANPIALVLDAYAAEPTGDLLETDVPRVEVVTRRKIV